MKRTSLFLCILMLLATTAGAETLKIAGSGSMIPLVTELGNAYVKKHPADRIEVNQKSLGQPGGIAALMAGAIDIAMSAADLTPEQAQLPLKAIEIARVAGVVAVNHGVTVKGITSQQLCDIYSGKITNWRQVGGADAPILALTRPESDTTKVALRQAFACFATLSEPGKVLNLSKSKDMFDALQAKKNAIGIIDAVALEKAEGKIRPLRIDGRSHAGMASGQWTYIHHNNLVLGKNRGAAVKRFLQFIGSPVGQAIIKKDKAIPVNFSY